MVDNEPGSIEGRLDAVERRVGELDGRLGRVEGKVGDMSGMLKAILESVGKLNTSVGEIQTSNRERIAVDAALRKAASEIADQQKYQQERDEARENQKLSVWQTNRGYWLAFFVALMVLAGFCLQVYLAAHH